MPTKNTVSNITVDKILESAQRLSADSKPIGTEVIKCHTFSLRNCRFFDRKYFSSLKLKKFARNYVCKFLKLKILFSIHNDTKPQGHNAHDKWLGHPGISPSFGGISLMRLYLQNQSRVPDLLAFFRHPDMVSFFTLNIMLTLKMEELPKKFSMTI